MIVDLLVVVPLDGGPVRNAIGQQPIQVRAIADLPGRESGRPDLTTPVDVPFQLAVRAAPRREIELREVVVPLWLLNRPIGSGH
jgi:hypothetical protein